MSFGKRSVTMSGEASAPKKPGEEIVLFLDGDMLISAAELIPFIQSVSHTPYGSASFGKESEE